MSAQASGLAARLARRLQAAGHEIVTAESCTGGLLASTLTDLTGASRWFRRGWICYANEIKTSELGVEADQLTEQGAVSTRVASQMARGALARSGADLAISTTGIAGPTGGTATKPVGLVCVGVASERGEVVRRAQFGGNRSENKEAFVSFALRTALEAWTLWDEVDAAEAAALRAAQEESEEEPDDEERLADAAVVEAAPAQPLKKHARAAASRGGGRPATSQVAETGTLSPEAAARLELPDPEEIERVALAREAAAADASERRVSASWSPDQRRPREHGGVRPAREQASRRREAE